MKLDSGQKTVSWKIKIVGKLTKMGELVVCCFPDTLDVVKMFLVLPKTLRLVCCDMYGACLESYKEIIAEIYVRNLLKPE